MRRVGRLNNLPVMEGGDDNIVRKDWIRYTDDNGKITLSKRSCDGSIKPVAGSNSDTEYLYFMVKSWTSHFSGTDKSLLDILKVLPVISSQRVNYITFKGVHMPAEIFGYSNGEDVRRYDYVKAVRFPRCQMLLSESEAVAVNSLQDLEKALTIFGLYADLEEMLTPISKEEFDSLEIPNLPL